MPISDLRIVFFRTLAAGLCCLWLGLAPSPSRAADVAPPTIDDLRLTQGSESILLSAQLNAAFDESTLQFIRGGVPLTFRYRVRLTRRGTFLGEAVVRDEVVTHSLQYDPVRQTFLFTGEGYPQRLEASVRDESEALGFLTTVKDWPLIPLGSLQKDVRYRVRVMATLRSVQLPPVIGYILFFTSIFNQDTPWRQLDFSY